MFTTSVVVIGAGMAGLSCARELRRRGIDSVVLERSRGVGGRLATRRVDNQPVDHGCPFLHVRSREFDDALAGLPRDGHVHGWPVRVRETRLACQPEAFRPGVRRWSEAAGVTAVPKFLAHDLDVRLNTRAESIADEGDDLVVRTSEGERFAGEYVVVAGALHQSLRLLEPWAGRCVGGEERLARLRAVEAVPVLSVIAGYSRATPDPGFDAWHPLETTMLQSMFHDSTKRDTPMWRVLVLHARPAFAREHLGESPDRWAEALLWEAGELLGPWASRPVWHEPHRWTTGRVHPETTVPSPLWFEAPNGCAVLAAGDALSATQGVEGAFFSGVAAAELVAQRDAIAPR